MPTTILIIEDDRAFQSSLARTLQGAGYEVAVASDGLEAIPAVQQYQPDLILLDMLLPKKDGRTILRELSNSNAMSDIPVLVMSGVFRGRSTQREVEEAGALGFLEKPFSARELLANVQALLGGAQGVQAAEVAEVDKISFADKSPIALLWEAMRDQFSGAVQLQHGKVNKTVLLERGTPKLVRSNATQECLGRRLLAAGKIDADQLKESLVQAKAHSLRQGEVLVRMGAVTQEVVDAELLAQGEDKLLEVFGWEEGEGWLMPGVKQMAFSTELDGWTPRGTIFKGVLRMTGARVMSRMSDMAGKRVSVRVERLAPEQQNMPEIAACLAAIQRDASVDALLGEHAKALYALRCTEDATFPEMGAAAGAGGEQADEASVDSAKLLELKRMRGQLKGQNHFERLGLEEKCTSGDVRRAFLKLAKTYHPDRFGGEPEAVRAVAGEIFSLLSAAQDTLQDNELRRVYLSRMKSGRSEEEDREAVQRILSAEQKFKQGEGFFKQRNYPQALAVFTEIVDLQPDEAEFIAYQGWTYYLVHHKEPGAEEVCKERLEKALQMAPDSVTVNYFLGQFHKACARDELAQRMFRKVLELRPKHVEAARELRLMEMRKTKGGGGGILGFGRKKK